MDRGGLEVLSAARMARADSATIAAGTSGVALMEHAAAAVARAVRRRWTPRPTLVLCGPGNNGGDGFGAAALLADAGWPVTVALLGDRAALRGDAAVMAARWGGPVRGLDPAAVADAALVVDALFGAGLSAPSRARRRRCWKRSPRRALRALRASRSSRSTSRRASTATAARVSGTAAPARVTVTFCRPRPAHLLTPGRALCGEVELADIGIDPATVAAVGHDARVNGPALWRDRLPLPAPDTHKYRRGHAVVAGGARLTGAARLAARAALRVGAGLVTVAAPEAALPVHRASSSSVMARPLSDWPDLLADPRVTAALVGPGNGVGADTRARALATLAAGKPAALDADALTSFADDPRRPVRGAARAPLRVDPP